MMLAGDVLQNPANPFDINNDGIVSPQDAAALVWKLSTSNSQTNSGGSGEPGAQPNSSLFYDVNGDGTINNDDFSALVGSLNGAGEPGDVVAFHLRTTDLAGNDVTSVNAGDEFILHVLAQDTQTVEPPGGFGVFAGFLDVEYDAALASVVSDIEYGADYTNQRQGDTSVPGLIDEAGAFANFTPLGPGEVELFSVRFRADVAGSLTFTSNQADGGQAVDVTIFGSFDAVDTNDILYGSTSVQVIGTQDPEPDLVAFAKALADAGVELWTTTLDARARIAEQLDLFEEGQHFLPIRELLEKSPTDATVLQSTAEATAAGRSRANVWVFPDNSETIGELLTLQEISDRASVPIPTGISPSIAPIDDLTVLAGSPAHIPLDGYDPNGDALTYSITVDNPELIEVFMPQGNRSIRFTNDESGTYLGDTVFQLFESRAPRATERIITLAEADFHNDITYHRVLNEFVIQAGDPTGTGSGGSEFDDFDDQFHVDLQHNQTGILSMAKTNDDTNDSQFFVTEGPARHLDFNHTIFGHLIEGERVRETISNIDTEFVDGENTGDPILPVRIADVEVFEDTENAIVMLRALESSGSTTITVTATDSAGNRTSESFAVTLQPDVSNSPPFLEDFPDQVFQPGEATEFQVQAIDVESDPILYEAFINDNDATIAIDETGFVTVSGFVGTLDALIQVSAQGGGPTDQQFFTITINADGPTSIDLLPITDSGPANDDNVTNITDLQFEVTGVTRGAIVVLLADGEEVGRGEAAGEIATITTANPSALGSGEHQITAAIEIDGTLSTQTPALTVVLDQIAPAPINNAIPDMATVGDDYRFDASHEDEGTDGATYSLNNAPAGMVIDAITGEVTWQPTDPQIGPQAFEIVVTDLAGNATANPATVNVVGDVLASVTLVATDTAGNPISAVAEGSSFEVRVFVEDQRLDADGIGAAFIDLSFNPELAGVDSAVGISVGSDFSDDVDTGNVVAGEITRIGGATSTSLGGSQALLATIPMLAAASGTFRVDVALNNSGILFLNDATPILDAEVSLNGVTIGILEVTGELTANDDAFTVDEDADETVFSVLNNDTLAADSMVVEISSSSTPASGGTAVISDDKRTILYTPAPDFFGTEQLTYTITDGQGATDTGLVTVTVNSINDPPTANDDFFPADLQPYDPNRDGPTDPRLLLVEDSTQEVFLFVIANDSVEPDTELATISSVTSSTSTVRINDLGSHIGYIPGPNVSGEDTFTYTFTDNGRPPMTATGTVTVSIARVNDAPIAVDDTFEVRLGESITIPASDIIGNDSPGPLEDEQTLEITNTTDPSQGTVVLNSDGSITYTPSAAASGTDFINYTVRDNGVTDRFEDANTIVTDNDPLADIGRISFRIIEGNLAPSAFDDAVSIVGDSNAIEINVLQNDRDAGSANDLEIVEFSQGSSGGVVTQNDRVLSYRPAPGFIGEDQFTYTISDGDLTDTATVTVRVTDPATTTNSRFTGTVYFDANNDGVAGNGERGVGGVVITLTGMDIDGNPVSRQATTAVDGTYSFDALPKGTFTIAQQQSGFLLDGSETANPLSSISGNDSFLIEVGDSVITSDGNSFAERGLSPKLALLDALSSHRGDGFLSAVSGGTTQFIRNQRGWDDYSNIHLSLSEDQQELTITATDKDSRVLSETISTSDRSRVQLLGQDSDALLLRIVAAASAFDLQETDEE